MGYSHVAGISDVVVLVKGFDAHLAKARGEVAGEG